MGNGSVEGGSGGDWAGFACRCWRILLRVLLMAMSGPKDSSLASGVGDSGEVLLSMILKL